MDGDNDGHIDGGIDGEHRWYFCLKHKTVEPDTGCPGRWRLGPYKTREEAANALQTARRRTEEWDAQDDN